MSTAKRVIKNTGYLYAKMGITMFISLYTTRLVLNALGASDFGIFNIVGGAIAMLGFLNAAMAGATQRFMSYAEGEGDKEKQKKIFNISFILHLAVGVLLGMILLLAGLFFFNGILNIPADRIFAAKAIYGSLIISTVFTVITVPYDAVLNAHENMFYYAIVGIIESFLKLGAAWAVVLYAGDKLILYGILMACVPIITLTIMRIYCHRTYEECTIAPKKYWDKALSKEMRNFAGWNFLGVASGITSQYGLGIVLNVFFGPILNAAQGIANQISGQLMVFSNTMLKAVNPLIIKSEGGGNREMAIKTSFTSAKFSFFLFSIFAIPFIIETPYILKIWLSKIPDWTILFCRLQLIRILTELVTLSISSNIYAEGNIKAYIKIKGYINIIPILLTIILFYYEFPPYTMYIIWILCWSIIGGFVTLFYAKKNIGISFTDYYRIVFFPCILISSIIFTSSFVFIHLFSQGIIRLFFIIALSSILHFFLGWHLGINDYEKKILISLKNRLLIKTHNKMNSYQSLKLNIKLSYILLMILRKIYNMLLKSKPLTKPSCEQDPQKASDIIYEKLIGEEPSMIARFGSTELTTVVNYLGVSTKEKSIWKYIKGDMPQWWWNENMFQQMKDWSGFFPPTPQKVEQFCEMMLEDMKEVDVLGSWLELESYFENKIKDVVKVHLRLLEPFWAEKSWTKALEGKKILVVHPFAESILSQYKNREKVFENPNILPAFASLHVIKAVQSLGGDNTQFQDWFEALEHMKNQIDAVEYDICLIGAGAYGFPLAAHVKRKGKKAVHLGGALQLLFGIKGKRWEDPNYGVEAWNIPVGFYPSLMNEFWIKPLETEQPKNAQKVEGACYW